jgi:hypothetical protein
MSPATFRSQQSITGAAVAVMEFADNWKRSAVHHSSKANPVRNAYVEVAPWRANQTEFHKLFSAKILIYLIANLFTAQPPALPAMAIRLSSGLRG